MPRYGLCELKCVVVSLDEERQLALGRRGFSFFRWQPRIVPIEFQLRDGDLQHLARRWLTHARTLPLDPGVVFGTRTVRTIGRRVPFAAFSAPTSTRRCARSTVRSRST